MNPAAFGPLLTPVLAVIGASIHLRRTRGRRPPGRGYEIGLLWAFGVVVGFGGLVITVSHVFFADATAAQIGFPAGNPFQFEVGMANLSYTVLGFACLRWRGAFWDATAVGFAVFYWGATYGHVDQYVTADNTAPYNVGPILVTDLGAPLVILLLLVGLHRSRRSAAVQAGVG